MWDAWHGCGTQTGLVTAVVSDGSKGTPARAAGKKQNI